VRQLPLAQSTVSQHLAVLKDAGLVRADFAPPRVRYATEPSALEAFKREVGSL
jgi:ArsR family transcriptional regulator